MDREMLIHTLDVVARASEMMKLAEDTGTSQPSSVLIPNDELQGFTSPNRNETQTSGSSVCTR